MESHIGGGSGSSSLDSKTVRFLKNLVRETTYDPATLAQAVTQEQLETINQQLTIQIQTVDTSGGQTTQDLTDLAEDVDYLFQRVNTAEQLVYSTNATVLNQNNNISGIQMRLDTQPMTYEVLKQQVIDDNTTLVSHADQFAELYWQDTQMTTSIEALSSSVDTLSNNLTSLNQLKEDIQNLSVPLPTLIQQVIDDHASIEANGNEILNLQQNDSNMQDQINTISNDLNNQTDGVKKTIYDINTTVVAIDLQVQGILEKPLEDVYQIAPIQDEVTALSQRVFNLETQILFNAAPIGSILIWFSTNIPANYWICDGRSFAVGDYPNLAAALGSSTIPDLRGYFIRGLDTSGTVDPNGAGRTVGSIQADTFKSHNHTYQDVAFMEASGSTPWNMKGSGNSDGDNEPWFRTINNTLSIDANDGTTQIPTSSVGSSETRPKNKAVYYIIRIN